MAEEVLTKGTATAIFAANNFIAIGALKSLKDRSIRVPEEMAVVGFDDLPYTIVVDPFLTAAAQPAYEMGKRGAELLLDRLLHNGSKEFVELVLPTELIIRRSSGQALPDSKTT
jgi:LacI family transcriptional regulator